MLPLYINGRFATQALTGVQRFAGEIVAALDRRLPSDDAGNAIMLVPSATESVPSYRNIAVRRTGRWRGHAWEQLDLPRFARAGLLLNLANAAPLFAGRQFVVIHDAGVFAHPEAYALPYRLVHKGIEKTLARSRARVATVSHFSRAEIAKHLRLDPAAIAVIPEGADHILRQPPDDAVLSRHGLERRGYVLAVGSLVAHKNLASLSALAQRLAQRQIDLAIVGGVNAAVFDRHAAVLPRPAKYLGRASDAALRALYEQALCLVFPSRYEGFGIPPVEAMACSCPVVAATAGAVMEVCGDGALYGDPDDPAEIAARVLRVIDEPALADTLREKGRRRVQPLTWDNAAVALLRVLDPLRREIAANARQRVHGGA